MAAQGDEWLLRLFYTLREQKKGKIKPYLEHDALALHDRKKAQREAYELGIKKRIESERAEA